MKMTNLITLMLTLSVLIIFTSCKKDNSSVNTDPATHSTAMLKSYQDASLNDTRLANYHQHTTTDHDSCYIYLHNFNMADSLFSMHFYEYSHTIYVNGNHMSGEHMGEYGDWNHESEKCGLDSLYYDNSHHPGDYYDLDNAMHQEMEHYGMTGQFSDQANQCFGNMQQLRQLHFKNHNWHN